MVSELERWLLDLVHLLLNSAISVLGTVLQRLRDSLVGLPPMQIENTTEFQAEGLSSLEDELTERDIDIILKHLSPVHDACYNAALPTSVTKRVGCTPGTRVKLLEATLEWTHGSNPANIYWLNGMAGTGKTTIAYTLCEMLERDELLGASFFCSRNSADCQDVNRIVPTIAYQLALYLGLYRREVVKVLKSYTDVSKRDIGAQFRHLISTPFEKICRATTKDIIVVIDALDECADEAGTKIMLDMLIRHAANLPIKFFVASRPEPTISESMEVHNGALRSIFWLHDIEKSLVQEDIKLYLVRALTSIDISSSEIDQLVDQAGNLFIFAATTVRYILPDRGAVNRRQRRRAVLGLQPSRKHRCYQDIDNLYTAILANALDEKIYEEEEISARRQVLQTVICAREPLTIPALAELMRMSGEEVLIAIQPLQSLLYVSAVSSAVSALHASFLDFLLSQERAGPLYCDRVIQSSYLAECCFKLMARSLKFNICGLESSSVLDRDVPNLQLQADEAISTGLFYSCRYWGDHLTSSPPSPALRVLLDSFLQQHLLFWMEVLNLKGQIGDGDMVLSQALTWLPVEDGWAELRGFTYEARNFLTSFAGNPTSLSTPHIYISALPFIWKESRVRATYWGRTRGLIEIGGAATKGRGDYALATWDVGSEVYSMALSSDGRRVASGSKESEVSVWDASSGARVLGPLEGHENPVCSVAFSPDDCRIASGSLDHTIRVWDAHNGKLLVGPLRGHTSAIISVAFSPDGTRIVSGSYDDTIRAWDAHTGVTIDDARLGDFMGDFLVAFSPDGQHLAFSYTTQGLFASRSSECIIRVWNWRTHVATLGPMEGHAELVRCIAYSPDGQRLASGSNDYMVRVWGMSSGKLLAAPFEGHTKAVTSVSFSPNGTQIVSGSADCTIRVWEVENGNLLATAFQGHNDCVRGVLFTTDGTRILSGFADGTIRLWDARQGTYDQTESLGHSDAITSVAMSPDGKRAASGSRDKTICVWDTHNGTLIAGPLKGHTRPVFSMAFSPDGARIVSGSEDNTLRTWDASTTNLLAGPCRGHTSSVKSVAFSPDGSRVASGSGDRTIRVWDSHTGESTAEPFRGHADVVMSIAFSPNGTRIVSGSYDSTVCMWDPSNGTIVWTSRAHTNVVRCVAFSPDGARITSVSANSTLVLDVRDGTVVRGPFTDHIGDALSVAFPPSGTRVALVLNDCTVHVQDVESGTVAVPLGVHNDRVTFVAFSLDSARIISASVDHTIRLWDVAAATRSEAAPLNSWSIGKDGWLLDSRSQRLFWVPSHLRKRFVLLTPSTSMAANAYCTTRVDHTTLLGDRWHECYDISL